MGGKKILAQVAGVGLAVLAVVLVARFAANVPTSIRGAVMAAAAVTNRELPLAEVEVSAPGDPAVRSVRSDASGFFAIPLPLQQRVRRGTALTLSFHHPGYQPLELYGVAIDKLCIAHLTPLPPAAPRSPAVSITNVVAKYSIYTTTMLNIGSAVKTFPVVNKGNIPCWDGHPCSPDGKWTAAIGSATLDAGRGNEFRNARASCIAGTLPIHEDPGHELQLPRPNASRLCVGLVGHGDVCIGSGSVSAGGDGRHPRVLPRDFRTGSDVHSARGGGGRQHTGGARQVDDRVPAGPVAVPELGRLPGSGEQRPDAAVPVRTETGIPIPVGRRHSRPRRPGRTWVE